MRPLELGGPQVEAHLVVDMKGSLLVGFLGELRLTRKMILVQKMVKVFSSLLFLFLAVLEPS